MDKKTLLLVGVKLLGLYFFATAALAFGGELFLAIYRVIRFLELPNGLFSHLFDSGLRATPTAVLGLILLIFSNQIASLCFKKSVDAPTA